MKKDIIKNKIIEVSEKRLTDKSTIHSYDEIYPELLEPYLEKKPTIFELGTGYGGGLLILSDLFPESSIFALDHNYDGPYCVSPKNLPSDRDASQIINFEGRNVKFLDPCDQCDPNILNFIPECDIIIEDASHVYSKSMCSFDLLLPKLKSGGIYIIEDIYPEYRKLYESDPRFKMYDVTHIKNRPDDLIAVYFNK